MTNPFLIDDVVIIKQDARVTDGRLGELAFSGYWPPFHSDALYRPLVKVSYAINWAISQQTWTFRLPNLLLHAATALAVFLLARDLLALASNSLARLHPVRRSSHPH